jgi:hypothetical protein
LAAGVKKGADPKEVAPFMVPEAWLACRQEASGIIDDFFQGQLAVAHYHSLPAKVDKLAKKSLGRRRLRPKMPSVASRWIAFWGADKSWWAHLDSNQGPTGYEPVALTN